MGHLDPQGEIIPKEFPNPEQPRIWGGGGGWEQTGMVPYNYWHLYFTQWML